MGLAISSKIRWTWLETSCKCFCPILIEEIILIIKLFSWNLNFQLLELSSVMLI